MSRATPCTRNHFGSRDGLLQAVIRRAARRLRDDVADVLEHWEPEPGPMVELAGPLRSLYTERGYARMTAWKAVLAMLGLPGDDAGVERF